MAADLANLTQALKLLGDATRLRLCGLLSQQELAVQELVAATGLSQSRVSNHLALLRRAGLVRDRREGSWSFHSLVEPSPDGPLSQELFAAVVLPWLASEDGRRDLQSLEGILERRRERSRSAHDRLAERWEDEQQFAAGSLRSEIMAQALPAQLVVADLGCGTGFLTRGLAATGARVIAVDHSERMLAQARQQSQEALDFVEFQRGELDALPLGDDSVDVAFANLVWHHLPDFRKAADEVFRVLRPGGVVVISDLLPHESDWMREAMGDLRLGLHPQEVVDALLRSGLTSLKSVAAMDRYRAIAPDGSHAEFPMFLVRGSKPVAGA